MAIEPEPTFDTELFVALCNQRGLNTDAKRANALGMDWTTVYRARTGKRRPSLRFAQACRRLFGVRAYSNLFPLEEELTDARH